jgi:hypothetical protein
VVENTLIYHYHIHLSLVVTGWSELTPFTTTTIISYNSFLALTRPHYPGEDEQFATGRVLEMAKRVLNNLQKGIVDSTISVAAGLEKGGSYSAIHQAMPYYESPSHLR